MNTEEAISLIKNTAFLGYNGDDDKMAEAIQTIEQLVGKIEQLQKERDAAVTDLENANACFCCKHHIGGSKFYAEFYADSCKGCRRYIWNKDRDTYCTKWEWRGIDETD